MKLEILKNPVEKEVEKLVDAGYIMLQSIDDIYNISPDIDGLYRLYRGIRTNE